jgi:hypothetical protein
LKNGLKDLGPTSRDIEITCGCDARHHFRSFNLRYADP